MMSVGSNGDGFFTCGTHQRAPVVALPNIRPLLYAENIYVKNKYRESPLSGYMRDSENVHINRWNSTHLGRRVSEYITGISEELERCCGDYCNGSSVLEDCRPYNALAYSWWLWFLSLWPYCCCCFLTFSVLDYRINLVHWPDTRTRTFSLWLSIFKFPYFLPPTGATASSCFI